ncbi:MAG: Shikimate kinase [Firmicutes bacterium]|nr:Shikimate kinase [Bacillota bacterium]
MGPHFKNIVLIGFMGTGKTSVGRLLAARLGRLFVDVDKQIEVMNGMEIKEMFSAYGEEYFRQKEAEAVRKISRRHRTVIATGGGVVLNPQNMRNLAKTGIIISLTASVSTILERTGRRNTRPLLNRPDREEVVTKLLEEREELYKKADFIIDTDGASPYQVSDRIILLLKKGGFIRG